MVSNCQSRSHGLWHRAPLRCALNLAFLLFTQLSRLVERISPRLTDVLTEIVERAAAFQREISTAREQVITMRVEQNVFRLCLVGGHEVAYADYVRLAQTGEVYEPLVTACLTRLLRCLPSPAFMDIGAFMGYFTCYSAALLRDRRPVFAVESNPIFCQAIKKAAALNAFSSVRVIEAALSDRPELVIVDDVAVLPKISAASSEHTAQALTLDEVCAREKIAPTIVKIDVHGAEGKVLRGMARLLRDSIQAVLLELHACSLYRPHSLGVTRLELIDWLEQSGFSVFHIAGHRHERRSGMAMYLQQDRFGYVRMTPESRSLLLFDRPLDVLILATKVSELAELLGPSVDLDTMVG